MFSTNSKKAEHQLPQKSTFLEIKQDDKFFCRLLSKESSASYPSFTVSSLAIPFEWESEPGTPKHSFSATTFPVLTPPPSYYFNTTMNPTKKKVKKPSKFRLLKTLVDMGVWKCSRKQDFVFITNH